MAASIEDQGGGKWRVRWREKRADGSWWSREVTVAGAKEDAERRRLAVIADVKEAGHHDPESHRVKYAPPANLIDGMLAYIAARSANGLKASSAEDYTSAALLLVPAIHELTRIRDNQPLPVTLLDRSLFNGLGPLLADRGPSVPRASLRVLWAAWGWMADDLKRWPQTPHRPSSTKDYLPPPKVYGRTEAPSPEHTDACLRRLRPRVRSASGTLLCAVIMRYTGLRVDQAKSILREDVDLSKGKLLVRKGKSRQEQAEMRVIPLSRHLLAEPLFVAATAEEGTGLLVRTRSPATVVRNAWQDATEHDGVPEYVWRPVNRENARPDHAFRAALQAQLMRAKVAPDVIDFLVGHAGGLRGTHYGRDMDHEAREAVDGLPPIDWGDAAAEEGKVVRMRK